MKASIVLIILLANPLMVATAHTNQGYIVGTTRYVSARHGLSLRMAPAKNSHRIVVVPYRAPVLLVSNLLTNKPLTVGRVKGHWIEVEYQGKTGFVFSVYLTSRQRKKIIRVKPVLVSASKVIPTTTKIATNATPAVTTRTSEKTALATPAKVITKAVPATPAKTVAKTIRRKVKKNRNRTKRKASKKKSITSKRANTPVNTKCYNTPRNYIIGQTQKNGSGTLVLVKYKSYTNDIIACKYVKHEEDFVIKLGKTGNIHGAKGDFLILNKASSAGSRDLTVWSLSERKITYTGAYRKMITMTPEHLVFWRATKIASIDQCPGLSKQEWEGGAVIATKVRLHFSDAKLNYSNETRCFPK